MAASSTHGEFGLAQALQLLCWWAPRGQAESTSLDRLRALMIDMNSAMLDAGLRQSEAIASLREDVGAMLLKAAKTQDAQALVEIEFAIAARVRRCAAECSEHWAGAALGHNSSRANRAP